MNGTFPPVILDTEDQVLICVFQYQFKCTIPEMNDLQTGCGFRAVMIFLSFKPVCISRLNWCQRDKFLKFPLWSSVKLRTTDVQLQV